MVQPHLHHRDSAGADGNGPRRNSHVRLLQHHTDRGEHLCFRTVNSHPLRRHVRVLFYTIPSILHQTLLQQIIEQKEDRLSEQYHTYLYPNESYHDQSKYVDTHCCAL